MQNVLFLVAQPILNFLPANLPYFSDNAIGNKLAISFGLTNSEGEGPNLAKLK